MRGKSINGLNMSLLRQESGEVLARNANRLKLIEAIMICVTPLLLYMTLFSAYDLAILPMIEPGADLFKGVLAEVCFTVLLLLLTLFFTIPLWVGVLRMSARMEAGEEVFLPEIFYAFSSFSAYRRAFRISYGLIWKLFLFYIVENTVWSVFSVAAQGSVPIMLAGIPVLLGIAVLLLGLFLGDFLRSYRILCPSRNAERMRPYSRSAGFGYWLGYLPWLVLSLFTFCILLLADVLPRMLISYFRVCRKLNEMTTPSEDLINE